MRDDLLDADTCVDWAVSQIPILQDGFDAWTQGRPYLIEIEQDAKTGIYNVVAYSLGGFGPMPNVQAGMIINGLRSSLDLLAASLAKRSSRRRSRFPCRAR